VDLIRRRVECVRVRSATRASSCVFVPVLSPLGACIRHLHSTRCFLYAHTPQAAWTSAASAPCATASPPPPPLLAQHQVQHQVQLQLQHQALLRWWGCGSAAATRWRGWHGGSCCREWCCPRSAPTPPCSASCRSTQVRALRYNTVFADVLFPPGGLCAHMCVRACGARVRHGRGRAALCPHLHNGQY
jgi:hypothetical protein